MPFPAAAAIVAGAGLLGSGANAYAQGKMNKKTRQWNEKMYSRQRADSLADWQMMNEYNSPTAQMKRFKEAGLNPNLIYGQTNEGATVRSSNVESWRPEAPQFDLGGIASQSIMTHYDTQAKQAQTDNVRVATEVAKQDILLKAAQVASTVASTAQTAANTAQSTYNLKLAEDLRATVLEKAKLEVEGMQQSQTIAANQETRNAITNATSLVEAAERIAAIQIQRAKTQAEINEIRERVQNLKKDGVFKDYENQLRKLGLNSNDELWQRMVAQFLGKMGLSLDDKGTPFRDTPMIMLNGIPVPNPLYYRNRNNQKK